MSSVMSGTYQSACIAKEMLESQDIIVVDSQNVTAALGILVLKAVKLRENGYNISEVEEKLIALEIKLSFQFTLIL